MINLILAVLSSMLVSVTMRLSEGRIRNKLSMLAVNYLMCACLSGALMDHSAGQPASEGIGLSLMLGLISGALYLAGFILLQWNIPLNGVALPATFMRLGVLVPTLTSILVFGETPAPAQIAGMVAAIVAILLIQMDKGKGKVQNGAGLLLLLLCGGTADAMAKVFEEIGNPALKDSYLLFTFVWALLLCVALCIRNRSSLSLCDVGYGMLIGIPNYFSARFLLLSLAHVPAVVAYPTYSVATIVLVTLAGLVFFKERLSRRQVAALCVILVSLALLNMEY